MRKVLMFLFALGAFCLAAASPSMAVGTADEAKALVAKAVEYGKANGKDALLKELNNPAGPFVKGDLYVMAYTIADGTLVAHPVNAKLVGKNMLETPDPDGKFFRKDIWQTGKTTGEGWVDYKYKNPETGKIEPKSTYVFRYEDLILCCGIYK